MSEELDDGFEEIEKAYGPGNMPPCVLRCAEVGRSKTRRISVVFRTSKLSSEICEILSSVRFRVAYNASARVIRIAADESRGKYEKSLAPKTEDTYILRFSMPTQGVVFVSDKRGFPVEVDYNSEQKILLIELPEPLKPQKMKALPPPDPRRFETSLEKTESPKVKSSIIDSELQAEIDRRVQQLVAGPAFPTEFSGVHFTRSESLVLQTLYNRRFASEEALMAATHDPEKGEDDRESKIVAVYISKINTKIRPFGWEIENQWGQGYMMPPRGKAWIKRCMETSTEESAA